MKGTYALLFTGLAAQQAAAHWDFFNNYDTPNYSQNECNDKQKGGFNWAGLSDGYVLGNYGDFDFSGGWTYSSSFGKRDLLSKRTFGDKCIKNTISKAKPASFGSQRTFSITYMDISVEFDAELELHYKMDDGSTCKQRSSGSTGGSTLKNTQCGGARSVDVYLGSQYQGDKETCEIGLHNIAFDCEAETPYITPTVPGVPAASSKVQYSTIDIPASSATECGQYGGKGCNTPTEKPYSMVKSTAVTPQPSTLSYAPQPTTPSYTPVDMTDVVPKCMNSWLQISAPGCKDNTDSDCYCTKHEFTKNVIECIAARCENDHEISTSLQYFIGICAEYVPENPNIVDDCPSYIPLNPIPAAPYAPDETMSTAYGPAYPSKTPDDTKSTYGPAYSSKTPDDTKSTYGPAYPSKTPGETMSTVYGPSHPSKTPHDTKSTYGPAYSSKTPDDTKSTYGPAYPSKTPDDTKSTYDPAYSSKTPDDTKSTYGPAYPSKTPDDTKSTYGPAYPSKTPDDTKSTYGPAYPSKTPDDTKSTYDPAYSSKTPDDTKSTYGPAYPSKTPDDTKSTYGPAYPSKTPDDTKSTYDPAYSSKTPDDTKSTYGPAYPSKTPDVTKSTYGPAYPSKTPDDTKSTYGPAYPSKTPDDTKSTYGPAYSSKTPDDTKSTYDPAYPSKTPDDTKSTYGPAYPSKTPDDTKSTPCTTITYGHTTLTVPQVHFTTQTNSAGANPTEPVALVPGTTPAKTPAVTTGGGAYASPPYPTTTGTASVPFTYGAGTARPSLPAEFTGAASPFHITPKGALSGAILAFLAL